MTDKCDLPSARFSMTARRGRSLVCALRLCASRSFVINFGLLNVPHAYLIRELSHLHSGRVVNQKSAFVSSTNSQAHFDSFSWPELANTISRNQFMLLTCTVIHNFWVWAFTKRNDSMNEPIRLTRAAHFNKQPKSDRAG